MEILFFCSNYDGTKVNIFLSYHFVHRIELNLLFNTYNYSLKILLEDI